MTSKYEILCYRLLDSLPIREMIGDTYLFCEMLRFYTTNNKDMNPESIDYNKNLRLFKVKVPEQTDDISCFYYVLRNMIGIALSKDNVFPIMVK